MTITLELWQLVRWAWVISFAGGFITLLFGDLPDHYGNPVATALRWIFWPMFVIVSAVLLTRGLFV